MRILLLSRSLELGGTERQIVVLANRLAAAGHAVAVAVFYAKGQLESELRGVDLIDLKKKSRWDFFFFSLRLARVMRNYRPDALYCFLGGPNIFGAVMKLFFRRVRVAWGVRRAELDYGRIGLVFRVADFIEAACIRVPDVIISNSQAGKRYMLSRGAPEKMLKVIPNGIDLDVYKLDRARGDILRREWGLEGYFLVGLVARIDPLKDHGTFLKAASIVLEQNGDVRFVCVGSGHDELLASLREKAVQLGLEGKIIWAGGRSDMTAVYNAFDLCCLSSVTEGFPNVIGEAMSCSVPCVSTDVGDSRLIIGDPQRIVPPSAPEALAQAILAVVNTGGGCADEDLRGRIAVDFSAESMVERTVTVLRCC